MLPINPPKPKQLQINLAEVQDETTEVQHDQFHDQVEAIKARNKRIADVQAGIAADPEPIEQLPVNKNDMRKQKPISTEWTPYD